MINFEIEEEFNSGRSLRSNGGCGMWARNSLQNIMTPLFNPFRPEWPSKVLAFLIEDYYEWKRYHRIIIKWDFAPKIFVGWQSGDSVERRLLKIRRCGEQKIPNRTSISTGRSCQKYKKWHQAAHPYKVDTPRNRDLPKCCWKIPFHKEADGRHRFV